MSVKGEKVTVTSSPTVLISRAGTATVAKSIIIKSPSSAASVWLGDSSVAANAGFLLEAGDYLSMDMIDEDLYAITASTQDLYVLRSQKG